MKHVPSSKVATELVQLMSGLVRCLESLLVGESAAPAANAGAAELSGLAASLGRLVASGTSEPSVSRHGARTAAAEKIILEARKDLTTKEIGDRLNHMSAAGAEFGERGTSFVNALLNQGAGRLWEKKKVAGKRCLWSAITKPEAVQANTNAERGEDSMVPHRYVVAHGRLDPTSGVS